MEHGPEQQIEHAQHAQHAANNPFDKRVTVSIAIVAAIPAGVTMLGHRAHHETLRLQGEALQSGGDARRIQMEAGVKNTDASDQWNFYQAKKNREALYKAFLYLSAQLNTKGGDDAKQFWQSQLNDYKKELPEMKAEAEKL